MAVEQSMEEHVNNSVVHYTEGTAISEVAGTSVPSIADTGAASPKDKEKQGAKELNAMKSAKSDGDHKTSNPNQRGTYVLWTAMNHRDWKNKLQKVHSTTPGCNLE